MKYMEKVSTDSNKNGLVKPLSSNRYLFSTYHVPLTVVGTGDISVKKIESLCFNWSSRVLGGKH